MSVSPSADFLKQHAQSAMSNATTVANRIGAFTPGAGAVAFSFNPKRPNLKRPPEIGDLLADDTKGASIQFLNAETDKWLNKYFPNINSALQTQPEEWACGILTGQQPFGLSREVFEAVWHQGRDRAYRAANSEQEQIRVEYSQRGFGLPPGAMVALSNNAEIRASEAIAEVNGAQLLRDAEIKLDLVKFAAEQAARLKLGIIGALASFHSQWIEVMNRDVDMARAKAQAYSALTSSLSSYYNVELGFEELRLKAALGKTEAAVENNRARMQEGEVRAAQNQALARAVQGFAEISAGAANAQGSLQAELYSGSLS